MCIKYTENGKHNLHISYKYLMITLMMIFTTIAIIDRFTLNSWPIFLSHPKSPIFADDWTATTFFVIAWIAGRELIVSSTFIYLLQCKCIANWIFEHKPTWLLIDDIHIENTNLHFHIGWLCVGLPLLIHGWLAFLPLINSSNTMTFYGEWMRPIDDTTGFYLDTYKNHHVNMALNDLYALIVTTICFLGLFPLSMSNKIRSKHFTLATYLHLIAAALYGIELLRTPFTIHCWFFCAPIMILYVLDRMVGIYWYRATNETKLICKYNIDKDYVILFLHIPDLPAKPTFDEPINNQTLIKYLGDVYWINCNKFVQNKQFAHPYTTFYNHSNELYGDIQSSLLFSSLMRTTLSHRGHKFPIRTADEHKHVLYHEFQHQQRNKITPNFDLLRTDTALSALSLSGLVVNGRSPKYNIFSGPQLKVPKNNNMNFNKQTSASASAQMAHQLFLQSMQHKKLSAVSEQNSQIGSLTPNKMSALSPNSTNNDDTNSDIKTHKITSTSTSSLPPTTTTTTDNNSNDNNNNNNNNNNDDVDEKNNININPLHKRLSFGNSETSTRDNSSDDDDYLEVIGNTERTINTLPTAMGHPSCSGSTQDIADCGSSDTSIGTMRTDLTRNIEALHAAAAAINSPNASNANSDDTTTASLTYNKGSANINALNPSTRIISMRVSEALHENMEQSFQDNDTVQNGMMNDEQEPSKHTNVSRKIDIRFGAIDTLLEKHVIDDNLWIDEKTQEIYKWNVGIVMKVHKTTDDDHRECTFSEYVRDELGSNYNDSQQRSEFDGHKVIEPPLNDDNNNNNNKNESEYKRDGKRHSSGDTENGGPTDSNQSVTNTFTDCDGYRATHIYSYGPYRSSFGHIMDECIINENPMVLIGTGAGISYILDFLLYTRANNIISFKSRVDIHFSCRSVRLFQWVTDLICGPTIKKQDNLYINAHLTGYQNINGYDDSKFDINKNKRKAIIGRASFETVLRNSIVNTTVFFCGSPIIQKELSKLCNELRFKLYKSHSFI